MRKGFLKSSGLFLTVFVITLLILSLASTQCGDTGIKSASMSEIDFVAGQNSGIDPDSDEELLRGKTIKILTQNTMLIPFDFVAPAFNERTGCLIDLILEDYEIVCLQEVFNGSSQNRIAASWQDMIYRNVNNGAFDEWQADYFNYWYNSLPNRDKNVWHSLNEAQSVSLLADYKNFWGVKVSDRRVNDIEAKLICSPYYVMGPDRGHLDIRQDGGLVILSRYPIIECSAMIYLSASGSDSLANKGAIYACIRIGPSEDDYIHVFCTHIQSHGYSETRLVQITELLNFISNIIKYDKDYIHPILIAGDFNVAAEKPGNWMEFTDVKPPETGNAAESDNSGKRTGEYLKFREIMKDFPSDQLDTSSQVYLTDSWLELNPEEPGFTWIGKDWITGSNNSYGDIGNRIAIENGEPERIDYIFYFGGENNLYLNPLFISLVPDKPGKLYCFDKRSGESDGLLSSNGCREISPESDCSFKSYTVSDHLGLELNFGVGINN